jgi:cytoskeletal protein CcmA (bactofilin family)
VFSKDRGKTKVQTQAPPVEKIETVIGPTASFRGSIRTDGSIRIDGIFEGSIETAGNLIIGEQAKIMADVVAHNVSVAGAVKGDVSANRIEVLETGRIWGDLKVNAFTLDDGGFVSGKVHMHTDATPPMLEAPKKAKKAKESKESKEQETISTDEDEPLEGEIVDEEGEQD